MAGKTKKVPKTKLAKKQTKAAKVVKEEPEEVNVLSSPVTGMIYETTILIKNEPVSKDQKIATVVFNGSTKEISLVPIEPKYDARMESLIAGDMLIKGPPTILVSKEETPFEWIKSFPKAFLGDKLYGSELVTYYED